MGKKTINNNGKIELGEYIILGSDNFFYACDLHSLEEVKAEIQNIIKNPASYGDPESSSHQEEVPETFYIYKGVEIAQCDMTEKNWWKELKE